MTAAALFPLPVCTCGHPIISHHITPSGKSTYCTAWSPNRCECRTFTEQEEEE